jgi:3'(2'), 5'-bisphosphate nucleotidase
VEDGEPVLGVVSGPARSVLYAAARGWRRVPARRRRHLHAASTCSCRPRGRCGCSAAARLATRSWTASSRSLGPQERISLGSALKFGLLAEGGGDLYVRRGPTSEWDTAAGHAVVLEAGGSVVDLAGRPLRYNVRDDVINPSFIAYGDRTRDWVALLAGL